MEARKHLLLIIPNLDFGGAQLSFSKLSLLLSVDYTVTLAVFNKHKMAPYSLGGELIDLQVPAGKWLGDKLINFFIRIRRLKEIKEKKNIDVAISFLEGADYVNILSRRRDRIIISIRGSKRNDQNIRGWVGWIRHRILIPWLYKKADAVVTVSEGIQNELRSGYKISNTVIIPNFYNLDELRQKSSETISDLSLSTFFNQYKIITLSGRLTREKGFDRFIPVFAELKKYHPELRLVIIGDGELKNEIESICKSNQLAHSHLAELHPDVLFLGYQQNPHQFVARSFVFVLPSLHEGFPNALVEAMAVGVPVMAADCPYGPAEILNSKEAACGLLLPVLSSEGSARIWIEKMKLHVDDPQLLERYVANANERLLLFSEDRAKKMWTTVIENND